MFWCIFHGRLSPREFPCELHLAMGRPHRAHDLKPCVQKANAGVGTGVPDRRWLGDNLQKAPSAPSQAPRPRARERLRARLHRMSHLAQDRAGWREITVKRPFNVGKSHMRPPPQCDTRVTPEDKRWLMAQRAAKVAQRRAFFDAAVAVPTP